MLDIKSIRENPNLVKKSAKAKGVDEKIVDELLAVDEKRRELIKKTETLRAEQKKTQNREKATQLKLEFKILESELADAEKEFNRLMLLMPNIPSPDSPLGKDERDNVEIYHWGKLPEFDFEPKSHIELGRELNLIDFEAGVKVSGYRGYFLKNEAALLHWAILFYTLEKLIKKGFKPFSPPTLLREFALIGSGHFPAFKEDIYQIANPGKLESGEEIKNPLFLAGTAEPSLLAYFADEKLNEKDLPIKICGLSQCYRSEVGSYGKDTKGLYRLHEFMKVEMVALTKNDVNESNNVLEEMRKISQEVLEDLNLPYRVLLMCTGDMGLGKYKMYDLETWMPSRNSYGETHSDSNLTDWQARRLNIKYKDKEGKNQFVHTLNNTAIASPRILISLLENNQTKEGSIKIPMVLQKYTGFKEIKAK